MIGCNGDIILIHGVVSFEHSLLFKSKNICLEVRETIRKGTTTTIANSITAYLKVRYFRSLNLGLSVRFSRESFEIIETEPRTITITNSGQARLRGGWSSIASLDDGGSGIFVNTWRGL